MAITLTSFYHFHPPHRHLDVSRAITEKSSSLHIASGSTRTTKIWFPNAVANHWEPTELSNLKEKVVKPISSQYSTHKESSQLRWIKLRVEKTELATESQQKQ